MRMSYLKYMAKFKISANHDFNRLYYEFQANRILKTVLNPNAPVKKKPVKEPVRIWVRKDNTVPIMWHAYVYSKTVKVCECGRSPMMAVRKAKALYYSIVKKNNRIE